MCIYIYIYIYIYTCICSFAGAREVRLAAVAVAEDVLRYLVRQQITL